jgi:DNA-binding MarR family transcriptional regulator
MPDITTASYLLRHVASTLHRQLDQILFERFGIGLAQYNLLMLLAGSSTSQRALANGLGQTEASISRQINLLEDKDLIIVSVNPRSKRERVVAITSKGLTLTEAATEILTAQDDDLTDHLGVKQHSQLIATLTSLHQAVCGSGKPFACNRFLPNQGLTAPTSYES